MVFLVFVNYQDWASITGKDRGLLAKFPQTQSASRTERGLIPQEFRVSLTNTPKEGGIGESRLSDLGWTCQIISMTTRNGT